MDVELIRIASEIGLRQAAGLASGTQILDSGAVLAALTEKIEGPVRQKHLFSTNWEETTIQHDQI